MSHRHNAAVDPAKQTHAVPKRTSPIRRRAIGPHDFSI
jgi:hypothetical protein